MRSGLLYCKAFLIAILLVLPGMAQEDIQPDESIVYKQIDDINLTLEVFRPADFQPTDQRSAIVCFFGGGWSGGTQKQFYQQAEFWAQHGFVAISADYRVKGAHKVTPFECVKDGKSAIRWVRQHAVELGIDPNRIVAAGGSAGGHVAACTGVIIGHDEPGEDNQTSSAPNAMILFNPVIDTTEKGYGVEKVGEARKTEISPCHHVRPGIPPTLIFHGTSDTTVPFENVERFTTLMTEAGNHCKLVAFEGRVHGFFNGSFFRPENKDEDYQATMNASLEFLKETGMLQQN